MPVAGNTADMPNPPELLPFKRKPSQREVPQGGSFVSAVLPTTGTLPKWRWLVVDSCFSFLKSPILFT